MFATNDVFIQRMGCGGVDSTRRPSPRRKVVGMHTELSETANHRTDNGILTSMLRAT